MAPKDSTEEIQQLVEASQEVVREAVASVLRVADERKIDPHQLLRVSFHSLQGLAFSNLGQARPPAKPPRRKPTPKRS